MVKVCYLALVAIAVMFLLSLSGCPIATIGSKVATGVGQYIASKEAAQTDAAFQRRLQADIDAGRIVRVVRPDGRIEYRNASSPAPGSADLQP